MHGCVVPDMGFIIEEEEVVPRSCSSAAILQGERLKAIFGGNATRFRNDSGSSTGMCLTIFVRGEYSEEG